MSGKNQYPFTLNWQSTNPATGFVPNANVNAGGSTPSGNPSGAMSGTNTIYSQILEVSRMDNAGLEVIWTGTPTGTLTANGANAGLSFPSLTFNPALTQPSGSASSILINLNQFPFKYVMLQYTNTSGSGTLTAYGQNKDLN